MDMKKPTCNETRHTLSVLRTNEPIEKNVVFVGSSPEAQSYGATLLIGNT